MLPVPVSTVVCLSRIAELEIIRARKEVNKIKGVDHRNDDGVTGPSRCFILLRLLCDWLGLTNSTIHDVSRPCREESEARLRLQDRVKLWLGGWNPIIFFSAERSGMCHSLAKHDQGFSTQNFDWH
jgi:hypothetical protein